MHRSIAQAFDSIPESRFADKPTPAQLSIGYIAQHIANDDYSPQSFAYCDQAIAQLDDATLAEPVTITAAEVTSLPNSIQMLVF